MKNIAIIPARSGSKGLVNKNIMNLNGLPLLAYTVIEAVKSQMFEKILITSDSEQYIDIAKKYGANASILRKASLSGDSASSIDVILDVLENEKTNGYEYDCFTLLQPTSPLRTSNDIMESYNMMSKHNSDFIVSVTKFDMNINAIGSIENNSMKSFQTEKLANARRQDNSLYYINGAIYTAKVDSFLKYRTFYCENTIAYVMPKARSIDIDDIIDFKLAEVLING